MRKYALAIDLILLATCCLLLLIDLKIKNDLIQQAIKLEEKISEQRRNESNSGIHPVVSGNLSNGDIPVDASISLANHTENGNGARKPRTRNKATPNRGTGNTDKGIPGSSDAVGP